MKITNKQALTYALFSNPNEILYVGHSRPPLKLLPKLSTINLSLSFSSLNNRRTLIIMLPLSNDFFLLLYPLLFSEVRISCDNDTLGLGPRRQ